MSPRLFFPLALLVALTACAPAVTPPPIAPIPVAEPASRGERLARERCGSCHTYAPPEVLTRQGWRPVHLHMLARLGLGDEFIRNPPQGFSAGEIQGVRYFLEKLRPLNLVPSPPLVTLDEFLEIRDYLNANAPERPLPQEPHGPIRRDATPFRIGPRFPFDAAEHVAVTLVAIDEPSGTVFVGGVREWDARRGLRPAYVAALDAEGRILDEMELDSAPVALQPTRGAYLVTTIGSLATVQSSRARLHRLRLRDGKLRGGAILRDQPRASGSAVHALADGTNLVAWNGFGYYIGELALLRERNGRIVAERTLLDEPGAMVSRFGDFDGDGTLDLLVLFSQHLERLLLFQDVEAGVHEPVQLLNRHPSWGFSSFDLADLNDDGLLDLVVTNGDNSDYPDPPLKPYHGVRIYLNRAAAGEIPRFEESFFRPMHGAYKVLARDFDLDADIDLAVVGRYLDESASPRESFVYLENQTSPGQAPLRFEAALVTALESSDIVTMAAGDLDGDGDTDLVLGGSIPLGEKQPRHEVDPLGLVYLINGSR